MVASEEQTMADDFDVEAMLEAPFKREEDAERAKGNGIKDDGSSHKNSHERSSSKRSSRASRSQKSRSRSDSRERSRRRHSRSDSRERDRKRRSRSSSRGGDRRRRSRSHSRERDRRRRSRTHSRERDRRRRSRSHDRSERHGGHRREDPHRSRDRRRYSRSPSPRRDRDDRYRKDHERVRRQSRSPIRAPVMRRPVEPELTPEERDMRTVFCMQLAARIRARDLEEFFSAVGKIRDVRLITDNKTRRSKGIAYIEFRDPVSVPLAIGLNGQKLLGVPIIVQQTQAEKNRVAAATSILQKGNAGPMRLYVGSLHFNITEDMMRGIFEPFGRIDHIQLILDPETSRSRGYGFITFHDSEDAKKALEQLNGFELAGRPMKVGHVTERSDLAQGPSFLDSEELDRAGIDLGPTGRLQLMAKLAEGTGLEIPAAAANALSLNSVPAVQTQPVPAGALPIATQCFMLSNMFDPVQASTDNPNWDNEIRDDVIDECNKHGGVLHIFVDKISPNGNVYVKCPAIASAIASVSALHGRWFAGKIITAAYVPLINYHSLFPDANFTNTSLLSLGSQRLL